MADVRAYTGVPTITQFAGLETPTQCAPLVVDSTTGFVYTWKTGDVIVPSGMGGTVTHTSGPLTANSLVIGAGGDDINVTTTATGILTFLGTPSSANLFSTLTDPVGTAGNVPFQAASTWTPVLTCATAGDLAVGYTTQVGTQIRTGNQMISSFAIVTSSFTWTTSSGNVQITGLTNNTKTSAGSIWVGTLRWSGITKVGYTDIVCQLASAGSTLNLSASGSGVARANVAIADLPTGGSIILTGTIAYEL